MIYFFGHHSFRFHFLIFLIVVITSCTPSDSLPPRDTPVKWVPIVQDKNIPISQDKLPSSGTLSLPLEDALSRVTKKTFWMKISPKDSPVSPEKFTWYHTGVDFETFSNEADTDIVIRWICSGSLVLKKWATGYGGVAVQKCTIEDQEVTVVYGHLKYESITTSIGTLVDSWEQIGILGKWYSTETDGERKHLHLDIHKGSGINISGYTSTSARLTS